MWFKPKGTRNGTLKSPRQTLQCPGIPALIRQNERGLEVTLVSKQLRKGAVLSCKPFPSSPKDLMHHNHRYRLFAGSDLRRSCQCLSAASLGTLKGKQQPFPQSCLHIHRHLEKDEWNLREGLFIFSYTGLVSLMLEAVGTQQITSAFSEGFVGREKCPRNANSGPRTLISWGYSLLMCMRKMFLKTNSHLHKGESVSVTVFAWKGLWTPCYHTKSAYRKN